MEQKYDRPRFVLTRFTELMAEVDAWKGEDKPWKLVEAKRAEYRAQIAWPKWCYLPVRLAAEMAFGPLQTLQPKEQCRSGFLAALAAWRMTQGAYTYDPTVFDALWKTPVTGEIPVQIFYHMPDWCVYILTPGKEWMGKVLNGFFAHADFEPKSKRTFLRLLLDLSIPEENRYEAEAVPFDLAERTIQGSIERMINTHSATDRGKVYSHEEVATFREKLPSLISLVLYLCSENAEVCDIRGRKHLLEPPKPDKTKRGIRLYAPNHPTQWNVAYRLGAALRREWVVPEPGDASEGTYAKPRPHVRRAHWHSYWVGKVHEPETRRVIVKWLPPIAVNVQDVDQLPTTVREVGHVTVTHMAN
jgi:hypothetical protein